MYVFQFGILYHTFLNLSLQAAEDALLRVYLTRTPPHLIQLPSQTFPMGVGDVYRKAPEGNYKSADLVESEIMYASSGNSFTRSS